MAVYASSGMSLHVWKDMRDILPIYIFGSVPEGFRVPETYFRCLDSPLEIFETSSSCIRVVLDVCQLRRESPTVSLSFQRKYKPLLLSNCSKGVTAARAGAR